MMLSNYSQQAGITAGGIFYNVQPHSKQYQCYRPFYIGQIILLNERKWILSKNQNLRSDFVDYFFY